MAIRPTLGLSNLLVKRVMRHRNIATLFRADSQTARPRSPREQLTYPGIVTAIPVAYVPDGNRSVPEITSAGEAQWLSSAQASVAPTSRPAPLVPGRVTPLRPASRAGAIPSPDVAAQEPLPAGDQVTEKTPSGTTLTDDVWRRLKTIFQRHQETLPESQDAAGFEADQSIESRVAPEQTSEPTSSPVARPRSESAVPQVRLQTGSGGRARRTESTEEPQAALQERPSTSVPPEPDTPIDAPRRGGPAATEPPEAPEFASTAETVARPAAMPNGPARVVSSEQPSTTAPITQDTQVVEPEGTGRIPALAALEATIVPLGSTGPAQPMRTGVPQEGAQPRQSAPPSPAEPGEGHRIQREAAAAEITDDEVAAARGATGLETAVSGAGASSEAMPQPVPLQSVWSVRRIAPPAPTLPATSKGTVDTATAVQPVPAIRETSLVPSSVAQVIERASAGGPTKSGIELITPSRPRPVALRQRERAPGPRDSHIEGEETRAVTQLSPVTPESEASPSAALIQTPIGPLPRDLWELIGEPVPERRASHREEVEPARDVAAETTPEPVAPARRSPASPSVPRQIQPPSGLPVGGGTPAIQRSAVAQEAQAPTAGVAQGPTTEQAQSPAEAAPEAESGAEADIGELARRVYTEIKHRLSVERERFRSF